jgi:hypothetical protein
MNIEIRIGDNIGVERSIQQHVKRYADSLPLPNDAKERIANEQTNRIRERLRRWFDLVDEVVLDIDLDAGTATIRER